MMTDRKIAELETHILYIREKIDMLNTKLDDCPKGENNKKTIALHGKLIVLLFSLFVTMAGWLIMGSL